MGPVTVLYDTNVLYPAAAMRVQDSMVVTFNSPIFPPPTWRRMDATLQQLVWQRAQQRCEYGHFPADVALLPFQIDYIIAEKHGGSTTAENRKDQRAFETPRPRVGTDMRPQTNRPVWDERPTPIALKF